MTSKGLRISSWAIQHPLVPFIVFVGLLLGGITAYSKLPINNLPNVDIPIVSITIGLPGAAPSEIESQITSRVESAVAGVGNIKHIYSTVTDGVSNTQIEFQLGANINQMISAVRNQMIEVRPLLPNNIEEPQIQRMDIDAVPVLTFSVQASHQSLEQVSWFIDDQVIRSLLAIKGVAKVQRQGGLEREIRIELDPTRLQAYGVTAEAINQQLRQTVVNWPAGRIDNGKQETLIRAIGEPQDVATLSEMSLVLPGNRSARLKDLGVITDTTTEARQLAWLDRQPVVAFAIYRAKSASEVSVERSVNKALEKLRGANPDIEFTQIQSLVEFTKASYHSALSSFIEGALLAAAVVFLFLRNWRATWITALEIPLSVIPTFFVMQWLGFSLNMVSLLALSLVSGILVDDAIVEIENIMRHLKMGKTPYQAAMDAADEIGLAVVATTLVIVAVFVPVSFMQGVVGQYFIQFGLTVAVATLFSLLVASLITPVLAAYFLKPNGHHHAEHLPFWIGSYRKLLQSALRHRRFTLLIAVIILIASFGIINWLPTGFMPAEDKSQAMLQVELPPGSRLTDTDLVVRALSDKFKQRPEVKYVYSLVGGADSDTNVEGDIRQATLTIQLVPPNQRSQDIKEFQHSMLQPLSEVPNARSSFLNEKGSKEVTFLLAGDDPALLQATASQLESEMRALPQLNDVSSTVPLPRTEIVITPRSEEAARLGVSTEVIANTIRIATLGDLNTNLARLNNHQRQTPIRVLLPASAKTDASVIGSLFVPNSEGNMVPLSAVADVTLGAGPTKIERYDRQRQISLEANLNGVSLGQALDAIDQLPTLKNLPHGIKRFDTGEAELLDEMFASFTSAMIAGLVIVLGVLILLFRTVLQPFTIMTALPLSVGGALLALLLTHSSLSLPAMIGSLMLMGIVGKNGILLVDFIIDERKNAAMSRSEAIIEACQQRAQPILMTTLAMIAGMVPVILGLGAGTAFRAPMAIAVIGGLVTSTALSLLFVPVIYTFVDDFEAWITPKLKRLTTLK
jgi:HAE1 family hydrophobic/amphiphilic exporter-1